MKRKVLFTLLWMLGFAAAVFVLWGAVLILLSHTHRHGFATVYLDAIFKSVFFASPLLALWLGCRGSLPGTKQRKNDA